MKPIIAALLISILLIGCTMYDEVLGKEEPELKIIEKEIIKEKIIYRDRNIIIPCNATNITKCPEYNYTTTNREIELIRRIRLLENQQDRFINHSDCFDDLNKTKKKLEDCKDELCGEWNSSWC